MFIRRISALALLNPQNEVLLQHRTKDAPRFPNLWGFFGGGIEENESPEEALVREAMEEIEYEVKNPLLFQRLEIQETDGLVEFFVFIDSTELSLAHFQTHLHEGDDAKFVTKNDLESLEFASHTKQILSDLFTHLETK